MNKNAMLIIITLLISLTLITLSAVLGFSVVKKYGAEQKTPSVTNTDIIDNSTSSYEDKPSSVVTDFNPDNLLFNQKRFSLYTYEDMEKDLEVLSNHFSSFCELDSIGETFDSRKLYRLSVGNPKSKNQYIVTGSIHAREYITTKLVMMLTYDFLYSYQNQDVLIHIVPMVNPDGVSISQLGKSGIRTDKAYRRIDEIAALDNSSVDNSNYLRLWKANANGVDLNRNFDALWDSYQGAGHPSADMYKGTSPGCEPEAAALIKLTKENPIKKTISYHTQGQVIYWYFGQEGDLLQQTEKFAKDISSSTGYPTDANYEKLDPAGYKDWALDKLGIPSITIEVGHGGQPVDESQISDIYRQNRDVFNIMITE